MVKQYRNLVGDAARLQKAYMEAKGQDYIQTDIIRNDLGRVTDIYSRYHSNY